MKHDLTTGTWQDDTGCPISIVLAATSDEPSFVVRPQDWVMTDKLVIAYSSVWPLARRAIIGISFPPIPWPMTATPNYVHHAIKLEVLTANMDTFQVSRL